MAASQENQVDRIARRLREAGTIEAFRALLRELEALEGVDRDADGIEDLRDEAFEGLRRLTVDRPGEARDVITQDLLPLCLRPTRANARRRRDYGEFLSDWLDAYPGADRHQLRGAVLAEVIACLRQAEPKYAIFTATDLGFRDEGLVSALRAVMAGRDDELGDYALRAIIALGVSHPDRDMLLAELHRRAAERWSPTLVACFKGLPDLSSLDLILRWVGSRPDASERDGWASALEDLTLQAVPAIAERHADDADLQDSIWRRVVALRNGTEGPIERALRMNSRLAGGIDTPDAVPVYLALIDSGAVKAHDIIHYRLEELVRPRQLLGWGHEPSDRVLVILRRDACGGSAMEGRWETRQSRLKLKAWETILCLGRDEVSELLGPAVASEANGYVLGELFELAACTEVDRLPPDVPDLVAAASLRVPDEENQRLIAQIGAIKLAHSSGTREAFEALLRYEPIGTEGVLLSLVDALADCAAARIAEGEHDIEGILWRSIRPGGPAARRTAAAAALARLIRRRVIRPPDPDALLAAVRDTSLKAYDRRELIDAAGYLEATPPPQEVVSGLKAIASGGSQSSHPEAEDAGWPDLPPVALNALARLGVLESDPSLLEAALGLVRVEGGWGLATTSDRIPGTSFVVGLLYATNPSTFAPAAAGLIDSGSWATLSRLRPHLARGPVPAPPAVVEALVRRIRRVQTGRTAEPELFTLLARLDPDRLVREPWGGWEDWPPQARAAFADALRVSSTPGHERLRLLLPLMGDGLYGVRRAAYRAASAEARSLADVCRSWAMTTHGREAVELRERAAEAAGWLPRPARTPEVDTLAIDPEPTVRRAFARCDRERLEREWATLYVDRVVAVRDAGEIPGAWRYGRALGQVGDDLAMERLERRRGDPDLPPAVQRWLSRVIKQVQKRWDEATRHWPEPWFARRGRLEEVVGSLTGGGGDKVSFRGWLWQVVSDDTIGISTWGGWAIGTSDDTGLTILLIDGRSPAKVFVGQVVTPPGITYFTGSGPYPDPRSGMRPADESR